MQVGSRTCAHRVADGKPLLEHRAEVDIRDNNEATPLHAAAFLGRLEVAKLLVENGAELNARGGSGETPIDSASADWGIVEYITGILQIEIDEAEVRAGRSEVAAYLASQGAKHSADLAGGSPNFDKLVGLIEFLAIFPVFHHLWFLYDLLWLVAGFVLVVWIIRGRGWRLPAAWLMAQGPDSEIAVGPVRKELQKDGDTPPQTKSEGPT